MAGRNAIRSGDGEASAAAANGLTSHSQVSVAWAAKFSLRNASGRTLGCHSTTAPHEPFFNICSAPTAHQLNFEVAARGRFCPTTAMP